MKILEKFIKLGGKAYLKFLPFVLQVSIVSTDYLYMLLQNFKICMAQNPREQPSYLIVNDILFSGIARRLGNNGFKIEESIREKYKDSISLKIKKDIALFTLQFVNIPRTKEGYIAKIMKKEAREEFRILKAVLKQKEEEQWSLYKKIKNLVENEEEENKNLGFTLIKALEK